MAGIYHGFTTTVEYVSLAESVWYQLSVLPQKPVITSRTGSAIPSIYHCCLVDSSHSHSPCCFPNLQFQLCSYRTLCSLWSFLMLAALEHFPVGDIAQHEPWYTVKSAQTDRIADQVVFSSSVNALHRKLGAFVACRKPSCGQSIGPTLVVKCILIGFRWNCQFCIDNITQHKSSTPQIKE